MTDASHCSRSSTLMEEISLIEQDVMRIVKALTILCTDQSRALDAETLELVRAMREQYVLVRVLEDGSIAAVNPQLSTNGRNVGMTSSVWETRRRHADFLQALEVLCALKSEDDVPTGWVVRRPEVGSRCPHSFTAPYHR